LTGTLSCTDLDVDIKSEYTETNFPITNEEFTAATGQMYTQIRGEIAGSYHFLQEWSTDDEIVVARAGNWFDGARFVKYYPDANDFNRFQNNDYVIFRYADILLMKAEAILRGGTDPNGETVEALVNQVYARATGKENHYSSVDLEALFRKRTREMAREGWRRNDLIRFGKREDSWTFKTNNDPTRRIFPVPAAELNINPNLVQNDGY
jgi:hypothetical protein